MENTDMKTWMKVPGQPDTTNTYAYFAAELPAGCRIRLYAEMFYEARLNGCLLGYGPVKSGKPLFYYDEFVLPGAAGSWGLLTLKIHNRRRAPRFWSEVFLPDGEHFTPKWHCDIARAYDQTAPDTGVGRVGFSEYYDLSAGEDDWDKQIFPLLPEAADQFPAGWLQPRPIPYFQVVKRLPVEVRRNKNCCTADFGEFVYGRIFIRGMLRNGQTVEIRYQEDPIHGWARIADRPCMYSDRCSGKTGYFEFHTFAKRGFRLVDVTGADAESLELWVEEYPYPVREENGSFYSSDKNLNRIWEISERTLRVCMDDIFNDCPHRDQAQWMDAFVSSKVAFSLFGITDLTRKCILQHAVCSCVNGRMLSPSISGKCFMQDYAMIELLFIRWYVDITGDLEFLRGLWQNCVDCIRYMDRYKQQDGLLANVQGAYLDNAFELCRMDRSAAMNAIYFAALQTMAVLAEKLGKDPSVYRNESERVKHHFNVTFRRSDGSLLDSTARPEWHCFNFNFSCEFGNRYTGKTARAEFRIIEQSSRRAVFRVAAFGPFRVICNGQTIFEDSQKPAWSRPLPAYAPSEMELSLRQGENQLIIETDFNSLNWDLFFSLEGLENWGTAVLTEFDPDDGKTILGPIRRSPRRWEPPAFSQTTYGYAAYAGLIAQQELQQTLREEYPRNYISVRVPLFCSEMPEKFTNWVLPPNTPWTMFYFLSGLFENRLGCEALALLRRAWGVMLAMDARNTWEEWNCNSSLCHAWGSSPCWFFHREILGVKHEPVHENVIRVRPDLFDLTFAEGRVMIGIDEWIDLKFRRMNEGTLAKVKNHSKFKLDLDFSRLPSPVLIE